MGRQSFGGADEGSLITYRAALSRSPGLTAAFPIVVSPRSRSECHVVGEGHPANGARCTLYYLHADAERRWELPRQ
jgi:hypothetical protein